MEKGKIAILLLWMLIHNTYVSAQYNIVLSRNHVFSRVNTERVDSIIPTLSLYFDVYLQDSILQADSILFNRTMPDTLLFDFCEKTVMVQNPDAEHFRVTVDSTNIFVSSVGKRPFVCMAQGSCPEGRLWIDADTTCTLILANLNLCSSTSAPICFTQKQKVNIVLQDGSHSVLKDTAHKDTVNQSVDACLYCKGSIVFTGKGELDVYGNHHHGIASSKNVSIKDGHLIIYNAMKNGIHCDKFKLNDGQLDLFLANDASKGIKAKKEIVVAGGKINGEAQGNLTIKDGETSYCTLLKSDGDLIVSDGSLSLIHKGAGGRCISVDKQMLITGGTLSLECHGDGGNYTNASGELDYYTPKCITVDDTLLVRGGTLNCLSTGLGGKGIAVDKYIAIGDEDRAENEAEPVINVETKGECIINNVDEDQRFGCPKGIKSDKKICIFNGHTKVLTAGMGGEGVESNNTLHIYGGTLECITYDDGINVADSIEIAGGQVYCNSADNDGIDSNGSITISDGIVASINQTKPNESFDSLEGQLYFKGGIVFGIGSSPVKIRQADIPCYNTYYDSEDWLWGRGLILNEGKYICIQKGNDVVIALRNENRAFRAFLTVMAPFFICNEPYTICEGDSPLEPESSYFDNRLVIGGISNNTNAVTDEYFQILK